MDKIRTIVADDERPAREFLKSLLGEFPDVEIVGEAGSGFETVELIKALRPDLALLDLQMPELSGLEVVKRIPESEMPLIAFVTAYDQHAIRAFELNALDYLLKPVDKDRLQITLDRTKQSLGQTKLRHSEGEKLKTAISTYEELTRPEFIERIPVKKRDDILLVSVVTIASIVADGELLHITTGDNQKYVINFRLKDLESRLDPRLFVRLSRGALVNVNMIARVSPMPGGTFLVALENGQEIPTSRQQSRVLRSDFLKL